MNNEEKILEMLAQIQEDQRQMRKEQQLMREEQQLMREDQQHMREDQQHMRDDITGIKLRLDYDVDVRLKAMNETIDSILTKLDTLDEVKELAERTADRVDIIHAVVTQHSAAITKLEKVQ